MKNDDFENDDNPRKYLCDRCRKFFNFSEIKYVAKGNEQKVALCNSCRSQFNVNSSKLKEKKESEKVPYLCGRCRYKFKHDKSAGANLKCPYCGKSDKIVLDKVADINKLIEESD